jgi:cystathionine beta-lyase/cystathionine gamma-synthase
MTHGSIPEEERAVLGISDNLIQLSVGIEDVDDLVRDMEHVENLSQIRVKRLYLYYL